MADEKDELVERLLAEELGETAKLGAKAAGVPFAGLGAGLGGRWGAKLARTDRCDRELHLAADPKDLQLRLYAWFARNGRLVEESHGVVTGVARSGMLRMNPVVIRTSIADRDDYGRCTLRISIFAKEGLIPQRSAEKAMARLVEDLTSSRP